MKKQLLFITALLFVALGSWAQTTTVNSLGESSGWYSDDTRNTAGTVLNGLVSSSPVYFQNIPGTIINDAAISQQIKFGDFYAGSSGGVLQLDGTTANTGKSSVKKYGLEVLGSELTNFSSTFRWYKDPYTTERTVGLSLLVLGSDNKSYSLAYVGEGSVIGWNEFAVNASTLPTNTTGYGWFIYNNGAPGATVPGRSLNGLLADPVYGSLLTGGTVYAQGFNIGSYQRNCRIGIDWLESSFINSGSRVDFVTGATTWFVNDNSLTGNVYTTAVGIDANAGTAAAPFLTLSKAISVASNGDVIYADAGSYNGITVNKSVTINGANAGIHPAVGTHATEVVGTRGTETILNSLSPAADNITIDGIHFLKAGTRMIDTYANANNFVLRNSIIESTTFGPTTGVIQFGGGSHTGCVFEFNLFMDKGDHTFYAGGGPYDNLKFEYNKFQSESDAIFWTASALTGGVIKGNEFDGESGTNFNTINIGHAGNLQFTDNWAHDNIYTIFQCGVINGSITGNKFEKTYPYPGYRAYAFQLWGGAWGTALSNNVTITNNEIHFNDIVGATEATHGIQLNPPANVGDPSIDASTIHVLNNKFINGGVRSDAYAVRHRGNQSTSLDADLNYWGAAAPDFASILQGPVNYCPWYTDAGLTTTAGNVHNVSQNTYYCNIQAAIAAADANDVIEVAAGTYVESGQIVISKNLTITGADKANTIIKPAANQTNWFQVNTGVTLNLSKVKLDGTDRVITRAINFEGNGVVDDCWFTEIKGASKYAYGTGVQVNGSVSVSISNCTFDNMGRTGIRHSGTGTVNGNTYTGKGDGDYLDYFILAEYGCNITIEGNTVTNCTGVASSDGSGSSAIAIWDDENTTVSVVNNILTGNSNGIGFAAINSLDPSWTWPHATIGSGNVITGGDEGISFYAYGDYTHTPVVTIAGTSVSSINALNIGSGVVVTNIVVNGNSLVPTTGFGVANSGTGFLDAECNWFGTTDYNTILNKVSGNVDFVNYLVTEDIDDPVCTGGVWPVHNSTKNIYYQTIQAAVTAATAGDVIDVAAGTFNESVTLNKSLTLHGAGCGQTIWQGTAISGRSLLIQRNSVTPANVHVEISDFSFNTENNQSIRGDWSAGYTEALTMDIHDNCFAHVNTRNPGNDFALYVDGAKQTARNTQGAIRVYNNTLNVTGGVLFEYCRAVDVLNNTFNVTYEGVTFNNYTNSGIIGDQLVNGNTFNRIGTDFAFAMNNWFSTGPYTVLPSTITNNVFTNSGFSYAILVGVQASQSAPFDLLVNQNSILSGTITLWGDFANQAQIDATCNWWGTANPAAIDAKVSDNVDFMPFLSTGTDNEPGTPGFQPVPNSCTGGPIVVYESNGTTFVSSHETIQAAINASTTIGGYVISVPAGTYDYISEGSPAPSGLIKVTKGVTIKAVAGARPIIDGTDFDGVFKIHPSALNPGNTVIIEGFEIKGNAATGIAMTMQGCFDVTPAKVIIRDNWFHGMVGGIDFWGAGAYLPSGWTSALANIEITNNKFYDMVISGTDQGFGVMVEDPANWATAGNDYAVKIVGNEFSNLPTNGSNPGVGIVITRANNTWEAANVFISGNTFNNTVAAGVAIIDGDVTNALVEHNKLESSIYGVMATGIDNGPVSATCNWWGTTDYNTILTKVSGDIDFVNYLITNDIVSPVCTGDVWPVHNVTKNIYYQTIQAAITDATAGDVIEVAAGTYNENISISKRLTIDGAGSGADPISNTIITAAASGISTVVYTAGGSDASNRQTLKDVRVTGASGGTGNNNSGILFSGGSMGYFTFDNIVSTNNTGHGLVSNVAPETATLTDVIITGSVFSNNGSAGIRTASHSVDGFSLTNCTFTSNAGLGLAFNSSDNTTAQIGGVTLNGVTFSGNNSVADLYAFRMLGNMSLTNVDFLGSNGSGLFGLYLLGGYVNQAVAPAIGTVTLNDVSVSGTYTSAGISFLGYSNLAGVSMTNVVLNTTVPTADRGHMRLSGVAGTLNLGNTSFNSANAPLDIRLNSNFGASGSQSTILVDATNATFDGVLGSAMTQTQLFATEDRIRHALDNTTDAPGLVTVKSENVFVTTNSGSIQRGIDAATAGWTVNVGPGTFNDAFGLDKSIKLYGANYNISPNTGTRQPETNLTLNYRVGTTDMVEIKGFEFTYPGTSNTIDQYVSGNVVLEKNYFYQAAGLFFANPANISIIDNLCSFSIQGNEGIFISGNYNGTLGTYADIHDNVFVNSPNTGFNLSSVHGIIYNNTFDNIDYYGVLVANTCNLEIYENYFLNIENPNPTGSPTWGAGIRFYEGFASGLTVNIHDNSFSGNYVGISARPAANFTGTNVTIINNSITGSTTNGLNNMGTGNLNAMNNYWGTCPSASGPATYFPYWSTLSGTPGSFSFGGSIANITASATNLTICAGSTTTIFASGGSDYSWDNGLGLGSSKVVSPTVTTTYNVTGKDANGCTGAFAQVTVTVTAPPSVSISGDGTIPQGSPVTLTASGATTYVWSTGATTEKITVSPTSTTTYSVTGYTGTCSGTDSKTVKVAYVDAGSNQFICNGNFTTLTATSSGIATPTYDWTWSGGSQTGNPINVSPTTTTVYTVTAGGISDNVTVFVNPKPVANAGPDITIASGGSGTLTGNASSGTAPYTYSWTASNGGNIVSGAATSMPVVNAAGDYSLIVTDAFGCHSTADIAVVTVATSGYTVSGNVSYYNSLNPQMHNVTITLKQGGTTMYTAVTPASGMGNYQFLGVADGTYTVHFSLPTAWGGVTSADIIAIQNHYKTVNPTLLVGLKRLAADVIDNSTDAVIFANDRNQVNAKRVNPNGVSFATGNWVFVKEANVLTNSTPFIYANSAGTSNIQITVSGGVVSQNFKSLCYGDVDASYSGYKEDEQIINLTASNGLELINFPNPFDEMTTIEFNMPVEGVALLEVFDLMGNKVYTIADPDNYEGSHTLYFKAGGFAPGIYIYKVAIKTSDDVLIQTGKMVISR